MAKNPESTNQSLVDKGFALDKKVNNVLVVGGIGAAAVGSFLAMPAVMAFGGATVAGSVVGLRLNEQIKEGYDKMRGKKAIGQHATRSASR